MRCAAHKSRFFARNLTSLRSMKCVSLYPASKHATRPHAMTSRIQTTRFAGYLPFNCQINPPAKQPQAGNSRLSA